MPEGLIAPDQAARYKEFGDWIRGCYSDGGGGLLGKVEHARRSEPGAARTELLLEFGGPTLIERVVVREDQTQGEAVRGWSVRAQLPGSVAWQEIANGTSMGNKWIVLLEKNLTVTALKTVVTKTASGGTAVLRSTSAHLCSRASSGARCRLRRGLAAGGAGTQINMLGDAKTLDECCDACSAEKACVLFVAKTQPIDGHTCMLYSATNSSADKAVAGAVSGTPQRRA